MTMASPIALARQRYPAPNRIGMTRTPAISQRRLLAGLAIGLAMGLAVAVAGAKLHAAEDEAAWIAYNKDKVLERLPDPDSARFRNLFFSRNAGVPVACGEVNAKTASGTFSGFVPFVGAGSLGAFFPGDVDDFDALWQWFCGT